MLRQIDPGSGVAKTCPTCGKILTSRAGLCAYCFTDVHGAQLLSADERARLVALDEASARRRRIVRVSVAVLVLACAGALFSWQSYRLSRPTPLLPVPAHDQFSVVATPLRWGAENGDVGATRATDAPAALDREIAWQRAVPGTVVAPPIADESRLYLTLDNRIIALSLEEGRTLWSHQAPVPLGGPPVVISNRLYLTWRSGVVLAIAADTGQTIWETNTGPANSFFTSLVIADGIVYARAPGNIIGLDAHDGHVLWNIETRSEYWGVLPPVIAGSWLAVAARDEVQVYERRTGKETYAYPHANMAGLAFAENLILTVSPKFAAGVNPASRAPWWEGVRGLWNQLWIANAAPAPPLLPHEWRTNAPPSGTGLLRADAEFVPAVGRGMVAVANTNGLVRTYAVNTGTLEWESWLGTVMGPPTWTRDGLLVTTVDGLTLLRSNDGAVLATRALPTTGPRTAIAISHALIIVDKSGSVTVLR